MEPARYPRTLQPGHPFHHFLSVAFETSLSELTEFGDCASSSVIPVYKDKDPKGNNPPSKGIWTGVCQFMWEHSTEENK